ncbi:hypothetical protein BDQ17DRAFT_1262040, partial [Cyathus striatus]
DGLSQKFANLLEAKKVNWNSMDVVIMRYLDEEESSNDAPVVIWIGIVPSSLSGDDGQLVVSE